MPVDSHSPSNMSRAVSVRGLLDKFYLTSKNNDISGYMGVGRKQRDKLYKIRYR